MSGVAFKQKCCTTFHCSTELECEVLNLDNRRFISCAEKSYIVSRNYIIGINKYRNRPSFICLTCVNTIRNELGNLNQVESGTRDELEKLNKDESVEASALDAAINSVIVGLDEDKVSRDQVMLLSNALGRYCRNMFTSEKTAPDSRLEGMKLTSYVAAWDSETNNIWKQFLSAVCDLKKPFSQTSCRRLCKCTDLVRAEGEFQHVSNLALGEAALLLQFSHSRYAIDLFFRATAGGSYSTLRRTLGQLAVEPFILPSNDIAIAFDNNQVVQRTWMFKYGTKQAVSTVTTCICFQNTSSPTALQTELNIPTALFCTDANKTKLLETYNEFTRQSNEIQRKFRNSYISSRIHKVRAECVMRDGAIEDVVSNEALLTDCIDDVFQYNRVTSVPKKCKIYDMPCIAENPSSYVAVGHVLDEIQGYLNASTTTRNFLPVYMDGSPYYICLKLVRETYICGMCFETINSEKTNEHMTAKHPHVDKSEICWSRKYRNIIPRPGSGHIEMIFVKSILSTFWTAAIQPVAKLMGFVSDAQQQYIKNGYDHHKAYCLLMITFAALSDELIYPYVRQCLEKNVEPDLEGYYKWKSDMGDNGTYKLMWDFTFVTLQCLHLFRNSIRVCNDEASLASRDKLMSLLYVTNNIKYQEMLCYDTLYMMSLNDDGRKAVFSESCRREKSDYGEGYDFLLEGRNKLYKSFLPTDGAPSFEQWLQTTSTAGKLEEMRSIAEARLELNIRPTGVRRRKFEVEVMQSRKYFRSLGTLSATTSPLVSLSTERFYLDACMEHYIKVSENNKKKYFEHYTDGMKSHLPILNTHAEVIDLSKATNAEIQDAIKRKLVQLKEPFYSYYKKACSKKSNAEESLDIYRALLAQYDLQIERDTMDDMNNEFDNM